LQRPHYPFEIRRIAIALQEHTSEDACMERIVQQHRLRKTNGGTLAAVVSR
jgi:hypothetical protein